MKEVHINIYPTWSCLRDVVDLAQFDKSSFASYPRRLLLIVHNILIVLFLHLQRHSIRSITEHLWGYRSKTADKLSTIDKNLDLSDCNNFSRRQSRCHRFCLIVYKQYLITWWPIRCSVNPFVMLYESVQLVVAIRIIGARLLRCALSECFQPQLCITA